MNTWRAIHRWIGILSVVFMAVSALICPCKLPRRGIF